MTKRFIALALTACACSLTLPDSEAGQRNRSGSYVTGGGKSGTYQRSIDRSPGAVSRHGSITTDSGKTFARSASGTYDRNTGAVSRSVTGPGGKTRTENGTYDRGTQTYDRTITGARGGQTQATTTFDRETRSAASTYVGPHGKTTTSTTAYNPTTKGFDTTLTGPNGRTSTRSSAHSYDSETGVLSKSVTGLDGKTRTVDIQPERPN